ncbi:hypothetical protein AB0D42_01755 [Streptomyces sp. NPDC048304]
MVTWLAGNLLRQAINVLTAVPTVAAILFVVVFVLLTVTAYRMHTALNR